MLGVQVNLVLGGVQPEAAYSAERKQQIRAEAGRAGPAEVFVPPSHRPGDETEVDFGEVVVRLAGQEDQLLPLLHTAVVLR